MSKEANDHYAREQGFTDYENLVATMLPPIEKLTLPPIDTPQPAEKERRHKDYLVLFMPQGEVTVDKMKVIDSWSSTGDLQFARSMMNGKLAEYRAAHGEGTVRVVKSGEKSWL